MTKRKTTQKQPTQAPTDAVESVKAESKAKVASKPKRANSKATAKPTVEINLPAPVSKAIDVDSRTITYASAGNAVPSKYEQFKAWLVFKLYYISSFFRGY